MSKLIGRLLVGTIRKIVLLASLAVPVIGNAAILSYDAFFTDTSSGLDWLNNQPLAGQSYNSVLAGYGGYTTSGWRYATNNELVRLIEANVGALPELDVYPHSYLDFSVGAYESAYDLIELLGINVSFGSPPDPRSTSTRYHGDLTGIGTQGWFNDGTENGTVGVFLLGAYNQSNLDSPLHALTQIFPDLNNADDFHGSNVSAILVRSTVAAPATLPLLGFGLAALGYSRRKRKQ